MRAASYSEFGPARDVLELVDVEAPSPGEGEVRVKLATSGVNPSDVKQRGAVVKRPVTFPVIPHSDGAGIIDEVGAGVPESRIGERVWVYNAQFRRSNGTSAEYVTLPGDYAVRLVDNTGFAAGACFGIPAVTAYRAVTLFGAIKGLDLLVQGGAGSVGHYAIQFAKALGANVITTISSDEKAVHAKAAGADHTINYRTENLAERIKELTGGKGVDVIAELEFSGNAHLYPDILATHGKVAIYGATEQTVEFGSRVYIGLQPTFQFFNVYMLASEPRLEAIDYLTRMCERGKLIHTISERFPLDEIALAHEAQESGTVMGNIVLDIANLEQA